MFKNIKIGKKLILSFTIISLLASVSGAAGFVITKMLNKQYSEALVVNGFVQGDLGRFNTSINRGAALVRDMIILSDPGELENTKEELDALREDTNAALEAFRVNCQTPEELAQIQIIDENLKPYQEKRQQAIDLGIVNQDEEALRVFREEASPYLDKLSAAINELITLNGNMGNDVANRLARTASVFTMIILCSIIIALVLSILLGASVAKSISSPLKSCAERLELLKNGDLHTPVEQARTGDEAGLMLSSLRITVETLQQVVQDIDQGLGKIAQGDLNVEAHADYRGDFVAIETSIARIRDSLNDTMKEISTSSTQVSNGSEQVSNGAQALSQGATQQASAVEELAATVNDISQQVNNNAQNAQQASIKASSVGDEMTQSNEKMENLINAMREISESSDQIGKIIKTIEDIAFQTNILALNAAVEAARAGTAGKGFAVVADEVRNLAAKSADASKDTAALIERSIHAVQNGTAIADETAHSLQSAVEGAKEVAQTVDKISDASKQQSDSLEQVTQGIDQISSVVQTNSATAQESAAASQELSGQAQMLQQLVGRFQLRRTEHIRLPAGE